MGIFNRFKFILRYFLMFIFSFNTKHQKSAFFISFSGKQYSDSPKAISEYLHSINPQIEIYWLLADQARVNIPDYIKCVSPSTVDAIKAQARSRIWVSNTTLASGTYKHPKTFYIQTWHGDRGFKLCGYDAARVMKKNYSKSNKRFVEGKLCDLFLVGSDFGEKVARSALGYNGDFLKVGIPRNDRLLNLDKQSNIIQIIKKQLGISSEKVLLYAPTFRDSFRDKQVADVELSKCLDILSKTGDKWICLLRGHSATKQLITEHEDPRIVDVSNYPDMADLLLISNMLITDYSSSVSDYILTGRPAILAQFNQAEFEHKNRSLYFNPDNSGYVIAHSQNELESILNNIGKYDFEIIKNEVNKFYGTYETGKATEMVCNIIINKLN